MEPEQIEALLVAEESEVLERKEGFYSKEIAKAIVAIATAEGFWSKLGVENCGRRKFDSNGLAARKTELS